MAVSGARGDQKYTFMPGTGEEDKTVGLAAGAVVDQPVIATLQPRHLI